MELVCSEKWERTASQIGRGCKYKRWQEKGKGESQDTSDLRGKLKSQLKREANEDKGRRV